MGARVILGAVGAVVGAYFGNPALGYAIGSAVGGAFEPNTKITGPLSTDLRAPKLAYGTPLPRLYGRNRIAGIPVWMSDKRAVPNTTTQSGKGAPDVETTTYTYNVDVLYLIAIDSDVIGITRVWRSGTLIYSALAESDDESIQASANTDAWASLELFDGNPAQLPWPPYEDVVGADDAIAYRHRTTIGISLLNLGGSDQMQLMEFEVITAGTAGPYSNGELLVVNYSGNNGNDLSQFSAVPVNDFVTFEDETAIVLDTNDHPSNLEWVGPQLARDGSVAMTFETLDDFVNSHDSRRNILSWGSDVHPTTEGFSICYDGAAGNVALHDGPESASGGVLVSVPGAQHLALVVEANLGVPTGRFYVGGVLVWTGAMPMMPTSEGGVVLMGPRVNAFSTLVPERRSVNRGVRVTLGELYTTDFAPPTSFRPAAAISIWTVDTVPLADVTAAECELAGLDSSDIDVTDLVGDVRGFASNASPRSAIEALMQVYYFEAACTDILRFVPRNGAPVATLSYGELAAGQNQATETAFDVVRGADDEVPARVALTCVDINADYEQGTQMGDRLVSVGADTAQINIPVVLTPEEIKGRALAIAIDGRNVAVTATVSVSDRRIALQPTDVVLVEDFNGTTYRMRALQENYAEHVHTLDLCLDDPSALTYVGLTSTETTPAVTVKPPANTLFELMDIPILRDADDGSGIYGAFRGDRAGWPGARLYGSPDGAEFRPLATCTENGIFGACVDVLGDWTGPRVVDEINSVEVQVDGGTLASTTRDAVLNDLTVNAFLIGSEIIQAIDCELIEPGKYRLSRLLRGGRGTEWATTGHAAMERCVKLQLAGIRRAEVETAQIGRERFYRAVTLGRALGSTADRKFTDTGVDLKPFSPVRVVLERDASGDVTLSWQRRTRLQVRTIGPAGIAVPLGEAIEAYSVDIFADDTFSDVVRTISTTAPTAAYSAADQAADGLTPGDPINARVYQLSASVGRGYPAQFEE